MAHFARIVDGIVEQVIVAEQEFIDGIEGAWVQTSYNTRGNVHYGQDGEPDDGAALRKNFAGIGFIYDETRDAFYPPPVYASWVLNEDTCIWEAPAEKPDDNHYDWDEDAGEWVPVE
jgi:hypothetical protein